MTPGRRQRSGFFIHSSSELQAGTFFFVIVRILINPHSNKKPSIGMIIYIANSVRSKTENQSNITDGYGAAA
jgi:hypothetical protein